MMATSTLMWEIEEEASFSIALQGTKSETEGFI
jgi:hypothetical protein